MARVRVQVPVNQTVAQNSSGQSPAPKSFSQLLTRNNILVGLAVVVVLVVMLTLLNDRHKLEDKVNQLSTSQGSNAQADAQKYQEAVSKLVEVPSGITPTVTTPTDEKISQLVKDNALYKDAKSGDVFLLYTSPDKSLFLVIYRPSNQKIILALSQTGVQTSPASSTTKP